MQKMTEYMQMMYDRYRKDFTPEKQPEGEPDIINNLIMTALAPREYGCEEEMLEYVKNHPDASFEEVDAYFMSICSDFDLDSFDEK